MDAISTAEKMEGRFLSSLFLVGKKGWGDRPVINVS